MGLKAPSESSSSSSSLKADLNLPVLPNYVFGPVPSRSEVDFAISVLQNFVLAVSSNREESKWVVRILESSTSRVLVSHGLQRLHDAIHLSEIDPFVKRLVVSLASDKALWDAIMSNELVRGLGVRRPSHLVGNGSRIGASKEAISTCQDTEFATSILLCIWESAKAKVTELIESFQSLMSIMFQKRGVEKLHHEYDLDDEQLKNKIESSLLLAVVIILIVVVIRAGGI